MIRFTVIVPTHDHAETLWFSVGSILAQTVRDFEVIVVGDGAPERTGDIVRAIGASDSRVRYMPNPKGERHGEAGRHAALATARGRYVAYQCDDDLWFPDHLETLAGLLDRYDLAHTMQIDCTPEGHADTVMFDAHGDARHLARMRRNEAGFGLACGAHTLAAYRRLPHGWRPAPKGINTDTYFWLQFLDQPWCRYVSYKWPDVAHMAGVPSTWSAARRTAELTALATRVADPRERERLLRSSLLAAHDRAILHARDLAAALPVHAYDARNTYTLGQTLSFTAWGDAYRHRVTGAYPPEDWGTWCRGVMRIVLPRRAADRANGGDLRLDLELQHLLGAARDVSRGRITVNGETVAQVEERRAERRLYRIAIPAHVASRRGRLVVEIEGVAPVTPRALGYNDDRELSIGVVSLTIGTADGVRGPIREGPGMGMLAEVGERLIRFRTQAGLDLETAAAQLGVDAERLEHAESGETALTEDELRRLASTYGVDPTEIFGGRITPFQNYAGG